MRRYLLDSNGVNAFVNRHEPFVQHVRKVRERGDRIGTCEPAVAELYYGLEFSSSRDENTVRFERGLTQIRSWPFNRQAAREYARIAAELKRRGKIIQVVDMMIAAISFTLENCTIVTTDSDFSNVLGLSTENWSAADVEINT